VHTITPLVVLLTVAAPATSLAQGPTDSISRQPQFPTLTDSQWVRLATPELGRTEGRLLTQGQSEVVITDGSRPIHVPMAAVDTLWTRGRSSGTGALVGAILLAGVGVVLATSSSTGLEENTGSARSVLALSTIGAIAGSLIGAVVGHGIPRWQRRYP
jgi:phage terminase large subunit-like protein